MRSLPLAAAAAIEALGLPMTGSSSSVIAVTTDKAATLLAKALADRYSAVPVEIGFNVAALSVFLALRSPVAAALRAAGASY